MKVFYSPKFVAGAFGFETTRKAAWVADSLRMVPIEGVVLVEPELVSESLLLRVHHAEYVQAIKTGLPRALAESHDLQWDPGFWTMVRASNGGVVAAALAALKDGVAGSLSSGLHHARRATGEGYCTFNGLVLAAQAALDQGAKRVLILDLDAHCGGGTAELVAHYGNAIHHIDLAVDSYDRYMTISPHSLDLVEDASEYIARLLERLDHLPNSYDLCLYNAGMDPYEGCPTGGLKGITEDVLRVREQLVFSTFRGRGIPVAFVLAGGYVGQRLDQSMLVDLHRLTIQAAMHLL
ncbi:hypothetical protein KBA73_02630 [Patescibacteria group bacterium]|nr:hypothetical protein [Patescibacteria group bacterium]